MQIIDCCPLFAYRKTFGTGEPSNHHQGEWCILVNVVGTAEFVDEIFHGGDYSNQTSSTVLSHGAILFLQRVLTLTTLRVIGFKWPLTKVTEIQIYVDHEASSVVFFQDIGQD